MPPTTTSTMIRSRSGPESEASAWERVGAHGPTTCWRIGGLFAGPWAVHARGADGRDLEVRRAGSQPRALQDCRATERRRAQGSRFGALGNEAARQQDQARAQQMALINQLQNQASGLGPSLAQAQLQQATDRNMQQAMALGVSQRGAGQGAALHNIANQRAGIGQQMAGDSAMLRLQEQLQARQMLGGLLGGMRGQDIGNMQFGLGNQASLGMQQAGLDLPATTRTVRTASAGSRRVRARRASTTRTPGASWATSAPSWAASDASAT